MINKWVWTFQDGLKFSNISEGMDDSRAECRWEDISLQNKLTIREITWFNSQMKGKAQNYNQLKVQSKIKTIIRGNALFKSWVKVGF